MTVKHNFSGRVALVTGGTSGIGRAVALAFAEAGADVAIAARQEAQASAACEAIEKAGGRALFVQADVRSEEDVSRMVKATVERFGRRTMRTSRPSTRSSA